MMIEVIQPYVGRQADAIDAAINAYPALRAFIQQGLDQHFSLEESLQALQSMERLRSATDETEAEPTQQD